MSLLSELDARGFIHQATDLVALQKILNSERKITFYLGFDPTGDSLHVGHLVPIMLARRLQRAGHKPIILMGGGTASIGDPSGKDKMRQMLTKEQINNNIATIQSVYNQFLDFTSGKANSAILLNNADWLDELGYINFLRAIGPHFSINRMLTFDSVKSRLEREQNLSFLEFNYMILQAYDFMQLAKNHHCLLQIGGSDQWGNIVSGVELTRRMEGKEVFGLTVPLITTSSGSKMGKTEKGAIWINKNRLSSYDYWQFWRNTEDKDVIRFLKLFTDLSLDEIETYAALEGAQLNQAKKRLANEATTLCHGKEEALKAAEAAQKLFEEQRLSTALPTHEININSLPKNIIDLFVETGLVSSKGEIRRLIQGGGARLNDIKITSDKRELTKDAFNAEGYAKLSAGKKKHLVLKCI